MSIPIRGDVPRITSAPCGKRFAVSKERETLADYVRRVRNEKRLSLRDVSVRSGGQIANSHISRIESDEARGVSVEKLRALAKGLGVDEEEIFAVARGVKPVTEDDLADDEEVAALFYNYKNLTEDDKRELRIIWDMLGQEIKRRGLKPKKQR